MVTVQQETYVLFGSNSLPSYLLTVYALPVFIAPVTNLRNTALIQKALEDLLGIPPSLGVVIYIPIPEANLATNGMTVRSEISQIERSEQGDSPNLFKSVSKYEPAFEDRQRAECAVFFAICRGDRFTIHMHAVRRPYVPSG